MSEGKLITPLSPSIRDFLRYTATGMITLSSAFVFLSVFIIIRTSARMSVHYSRLLVIVTLFPLLSDIVLHFVIDPVPLIPLLCVHRGHPVLPIPGSATVYYVIWVTTLVWNGCAYAACFMHRHQTVVPPGFPGKLTARQQRIILCALVAFSSICGPILLFAKLADNASIPLRTKTAGFTDSELSRTDCYDFDVALVFLGYAFVIIAISIIFIAVLVSHIFVLLKDVALASMSERTRSFHNMMTKALVIQAAVAVVFLIAPLITSFAIAIAGIEISGILVELGQFSLPALQVLYPLTFISSHSFIHALALLRTTPLYRKAFRDLLFKGFNGTAVHAIERTEATTEYRKQDTSNA